MASAAGALAAADTKTDRFLKQNRHLRQLPASAAKAEAGERKHHIYLHFFFQ